MRGFCCFRGLDCGLWQSYVESAASEHDQGDEVVDVVEAVGHADGDLDPVVGCFESGVGAAQPDGPEDVGASASDLFGEFDDLGYAAVRGPGHPVVEFAARPDHAVTLVVDDHRDVRMAFAVAGLVHADRRQAVERRGHRRLDAFGDPTGDVSRGPPRDMKETADGLLARDAHQPRALRLEIPGEPAARLRPRHGGDHDAAFRAVHARHRGDQFDPPAAEILMTPATHAAAPVVTMTASAASGAPEHAPARAHADLEHGHGTQRRVDDARVLDHHAFDVEKLVAYAVHQTLCGCCFSRSMNILPKKRSSLTPTTTQRRTHTHKNSNSAIYETKHEGPDIPQIGK